MKKHTKRIAVAISSVTVAGLAVLTAGGPASASTPSPAHVQRPTVGVNPTDYRWDHGVGYLIEQGYCWDENRGWHHDDRATGSSWHSSDGRCYQGDQGRGWKSERSGRHPWNRYERDDRGWDHHGRTHGDR
ncbi:hypothetical protein [Streptomyces sp. PanSC9]|uniref:hypothetical protein n=1 Tax=Streptomyces sp. PanSC9 TaxID=1520461 RepID=UPI000F49F8E3|nr:hypothetical protein [Streptomyces sp. PanSC9]ROP55889.1 hypothetical protein EDD94_5462 [Streptomyces sp. PanSC9]